MPGQPGCHIRFETAIATELKRCTDQIYAGNVEDRATMAAKLKERKIANTKASVVLGTDEPLWETDMMRSMSNGEITPGVHPVHDRGQAAGRFPGGGTQDRPLHRRGHGRRTHDELHADQYDGGSYRRDA